MAPQELRDPSPQAPTGSSEETIAKAKQSRSEKKARKVRGAPQGPHSRKHRAGMSTGRPSPVLMKSQPEGDFRAIQEPAPHPLNS